MTQTHHDGRVQTALDGGSQTPADGVAPGEPAWSDGRDLLAWSGDTPDPAAVIAELAIQVAEASRCLDALVAGADAIRGDLESVGGALVQVCGLSGRPPRPPVDGTPDVAASSAVGMRRRDGRPGRSVRGV